MDIQTEIGSLENLEKIVKLNFNIFKNLYNFPPYSPQEYREKLKEVSPLIYVSRDGEKIIGDCIAFARDNSMYIWIMAVDKNYRGQGLATQYFELVEKFAKEKKFKTVTIKTYNTNKEMLRLLIKRDYNIVDLETSKTNPKYNTLRLKLDL